LEVWNRSFRIVKLSAQVRSTHSQDGAIVLDILHGQMFSANVVGSRILELLKQERTEAQMIEELSREFCVPREVVHADLREFLAHLEKHHLLETRFVNGQR
jgi:proline dehydrogenase